MGPISYALLRRGFPDEGSVPKRASSFVELATIFVETKEKKKLALLITAATLGSLAKPGADNYASRNKRSHLLK